MISNVTIGNLLALSTVSDSTVFAGEDNGLTRKISASLLKTYMSSLATVTATSIGGTLTTAAQPNITSVGTLSSLNVTNAGAFGSLTATSGSITTLTATTATIGTINGINVVGSATIRNDIGSTFGGQIALVNTAVGATNPNKNIRIGPSGNLEIINNAYNNVIASLSDGGNFKANGSLTGTSIYMTNGVFWANGSAYSSGSSGGTVTLTAVASDIIPTANLTYNIGSTTSWWNNIYGKAIQAQYADLAENYKSMDNYAPGTVVEWSRDELFDEELVMLGITHNPYVAGVISTNPAYLMNSAMPGIPLALSGRVPCRVVGPIAKGDRLAVVAPGTAGRLDMSLYQPGCVIGYALSSVPDGEFALIEIVIMKF